MFSPPSRGLPEASRLAGGDSLIMNNLLTMTSVARSQQEQAAALECNITDRSTLENDLIV